MTARSGRTDVLRESARVLVVKPSSLGDLVHTMPLVVRLKEVRPDVEIDWLVNRSFAPLLEGHPAIDRVVPFDRGRWQGPLATWEARGELRDLARRLRTRRYDVALDLQGLLRSAVLSVLSGARRRIGFAGAREGSAFFYHRRHPQPARLVHAVHRNLSLLEAIGVRVDPTVPIRFDLAPSDEDLARTRALLGPGDRPRVAVFPLGRWPSKTWPAAAAADLLDRLDASGATGVLAGAASEADYAAEVVARATRPHVDAVGRTDLRGLVALIAQADVVVAHDSAALHLASALDVPTVALFGPSNPRYSGPFGVPNRVVRLGLDCSPCMRRTCPLGTTACLHQLSGQAVHEAVLPLLAGTKRPPAGPGVSCRR